MAGKSAWIKPTANDVTTLLSSVVQGGYNADKQGERRAGNALGLAVEQVRGAIMTGNRVPLDATQGSIPPSGHIHTVCLAVSMMISSTPNLTFAIRDEFGNQIKDAKQWLKDVRCGDMTVEYPVTPDQSTIPNAGIQMYGGEPPVDMSTDGGASLIITEVDSPAILGAPLNLTAISGFQRVSLSWQMPVNPTNVPITYSVYRGGTMIATGLVSSDFTDAGLVTGTSYSYTVTAVNSAGESVQSLEATAIAQ